jgi:hypothetical protein
MRTLESGSDRRRNRSTKRATPKVRLEQGSKQPDYVPGFQPAKITRSKNRVSIAIVSARPVPFGPGLESTDTVALAAHLASELALFIKHGPDVRGGRATLGERLHPVLEQYAKVLQEDDDSNLAFCLAETACKVVRGVLTPAQGLALARRMRGEPSWVRGSSGPVDEQDVVAAARDSQRGRPTPLLARAARVYGVLAWKSRASVQPARIDGREGRSSALLALLKRADDALQLEENSRKQAADSESSSARSVRPRKHAESAKRRKPRPTPATAAGPREPRRGAPAHGDHGRPGVAARGVRRVCNVHWRRGAARQDLAARSRLRSCRSCPNISARRARA